MKVIVILLLFPISLLADDIYLKGGSVIRNVKIVNCAADSVCYSNALNIEGVRSVPASDVLQSVSASVNPERGMYMAMPFINDKPAENVVFVVEYPYQPVLLPVALLCGVVAWDKFETAADNEHDDELQTRQYIMGGIAVVCGLAAVYVALQPVVVAVSPSRVSLSYGF